MEPSAGATEIPFEGGRATLLWTEEDALDLQIKLDEPAREAEAMTWVVTAAADRFGDGIFAWQLHLGPQIESLLVIPNDFLTARNFIPAQLGIEVVEHAGGEFLWLRIPRNGAIPELLAPGDRLDLHALWIQQAPLASLVVPETDALVAGAGAVAGLDATEGPSLSPLPNGRTFELGEPIWQRFRLADGEDWAGASVTLARASSRGSYEIMRVLWIRPDPETRIFEYSMDTSTFLPGSYELIIVLIPGGPTQRTVLQIVSASE